MQHRQRIGIKGIIKGLLVFLVFIFVQNIPVHADKGDLKINNHVIYDKDEGSQSNSATFTINQLFMKEMSDQDRQLNEEKVTLIANVQKEVFMKEIPIPPTADQQMKPFLFSNDYVLNDSLDFENSETKGATNIGFVIFCIIGGLFVLGMGILLGRAFPTWVKKG